MCFRTPVLLSFFIVALVTNASTENEQHNKKNHVFIRTNSSKKPILRRNSTIGNIIAKIDKQIEESLIIKKELDKETNECFNEQKKTLMLENELKNNDLSEDNDLQDDNSFEEITERLPGNDIMHTIPEKQLRKMYEEEKELRVDLDKALKNEEKYLGEKITLQKQVATEKLKKRLSFALNIFLLCGAGYFAFEYWRLWKLLLKALTPPYYLAIL